MFLDKNSLVLGILLGLIVPFVGYAIWLMIFEQLENAGIMSATGFSENWRERTIALLAICMNLIPFSVYNRRRYYNTMRGMVFPTILLVIIWFVLYGRNLIGV